MKWSSKDKTPWYLPKEAEHIIVKSAAINLPEPKFT
jgi:hypothetical protein